MRMKFENEDIIKLCVKMSNMIYSWPDDLKKFNQNSGKIPSAPPPNMNRNWNYIFQHSFVAKVSLLTPG